MWINLSKAVQVSGGWIPVGVDCAWKTWAIMRSLITAVTLHSNMPPVDNQNSQLLQPSVCFFIFVPVCLSSFRFVFHSILLSLFLILSLSLANQASSSVSPPLLCYPLSSFYIIKECEIPRLYSLTVEWSYVGFLLTFIQVRCIKPPFDDCFICQKQDEFEVLFSPVLMLKRTQICRANLR